MRITDIPQAKIPPIALWSSIEPGLGIIACNLSTLRKLFQLVYTRFVTAQSYLAYVRMRFSPANSALHDPEKSFSSSNPNDDGRQKPRITTLALTDPNIQMSKGPNVSSTEDDF